MIMFIGMRNEKIGFFKKLVLVLVLMWLGVVMFIVGCWFIKLIFGFMIIVIRYLYWIFMEDVLIRNDLYVMKWFILVCMMKIWFFWMIFGFVVLIFVLVLMVLCIFLIGWILVNVMRMMEFIGWVGVFIEFFMILGCGVMWINSLICCWYWIWSWLNFSFWVMNGLFDKFDIFCGSDMLVGERWVKFMRNWFVGLIFLMMKLNICEWCGY